MPKKLPKTDVVIVGMGAAGGVAAGLPYLNEVRVWLNSGGNLNDNYSGLTFNYAPFEAADFNSGGVENLSGALSANDAFLREPSSIKRKILLSSSTA